MLLGATFPQTEIGADPGAIRAYAQAVEDLGFDYILTYDHVLGADWARHPERAAAQGRVPPYSHKTQFHEPFVLFGFLAGVTRRIGFATGVLVLGQRQTALVAKQAAEVDILTGGRLRLGIGTGWNDVEYEALGMNFHNRGVRSEEQIALLRALWTDEAVVFEGKWHRVMAAGINPLPIQRPIPVWLGGRAEPVIRRAARIADGWFINATPEPRTLEAVARLRQYAREAGRDPASIGIEGSIALGSERPEDRARVAAAWRGAGATHVTFNTMGSGFQRVDDHIAALRRFKAAIAP